MNKKILIRILIIVILFIFFCMAYRLINTYAVFYSEGQGKVVQKNATWTIFVNKSNVSAENSFNIDTFEVEENSHVKEGRIAPNVTGSFFIEIDPRNTDVSIKYSISLDKTGMSNEKIKIISIEEIANGNTLIQESEDTYTGIINLVDIKASKTNKVKIRINWENDEENNQKDTIMGTRKDYKMNLPVNVKITQYLGEIIEEFVPAEENVIE